MRTYVRPSQLSVSEFCPMAAQENEGSPLARVAILSTAWHAKVAGNDTLVGELRPDERKEVETYGTPTDTQCGDVPLPWSLAVKETHVQLYERDTLITEGTADAYWLAVIDGRQWAFVADNKRNTWSVPDGPDTLQLAAYGHAICQKHSCSGYTPGLWSGVDSEWSWGTPVDLSTPEALDLWLRVKRSAKNDARLRPNDPDKQRYVTGAHCSSCYGRMRCPAFASLDAPDDAVENFAQYDPAELLLQAKSMAERADRIVENVKTFAERGGVVKDPTTGMVFLPKWSKGRKSLDREALEAAGVRLEDYQKMGKPYPVFDWRKP